MTKRNYNLGRRAETAAETRLRLVEATAALHAERGISATSLRDVAERAGVSVGTAYHHFPTYLDAIEACGRHTMTAAPLPRETLFDTIRRIDQRVETLVAELCDWYERNPWFEHIRAERALYPPVEAHMTQFERALELLFRSAARCTDDQARTIAALSDAAVYRNLRRAGLPPAVAGMRITDAVLAWLRSRKNKQRRTP